MKQYINLYQEQFHKRKDWEKIGKFSVFLLFLVLFFGFSLYKTITINSLENLIIERQENLRRLENQYRILEKNNISKVKDMKLATEVSRMRNISKGREQAIDILEGDDVGNMVGFSSLLQSLGRQRDKIKNIWLTELYIGNGGYDIRLTGNHFGPELLLQFIEGLGSEVLFEDREFKYVKISESKEKANTTKFVLDTRKESGDIINENYQLSKEAYMIIINSFDYSKVNH